MNSRADISGVDLAIFSGKLNSICEEMGHVLQRSAVSPNIKDRLDFSCAVFDIQGHMLAQAAHIPVHLGSMAYAMKGLVSGVVWHPGDMLVLNDPFQGGTHLPDVTVISPFFIGDTLAGFFANRAHHANIGSDTPGSMPLSHCLEEEGVLITPCKLYKRGVLNDTVAKLLRSIDRNCVGEVPEDFSAQASANLVGVKRIERWLSAPGFCPSSFERMSKALNDYGSEIVVNFLSKLPNHWGAFEDYLESDGFGARDIKIALRIERDGPKLRVDFSGSSEQVKGNLNCPESVTAAAVYYVVACLLPDYTPRCQGVFEHIQLIVPYGSVLNASPGAAVAAGNVETSMRVVDAVQGAFASLGVLDVAASQGTMNNVAMGGKAGAFNWDYYETLGGGMGAHSTAGGLSAVQCHMTNTLNTPVESLELHYPLRIEQYRVRKNSGGLGQHSGGDGISRQYRFLESAQLTLLTERRYRAPWGLNAQEGEVGINLLNGEELPAKCHRNVRIGDLLEVLTPGGGGWSASE